jgi:hypothetical protein
VSVYVFACMDACGLNYRLQNSFIRFRTCKDFMLLYRIFQKFAETLWACSGVPVEPESTSMYVRVD